MNDAYRKWIGRFTVRCVFCGKLSGGQLPNRGHCDTTARYPRKHRLPNGERCIGNYELAEWVTVNADGSIESHGT